MAIETQPIEPRTLARFGANVRAIDTPESMYDPDPTVRVSKKRKSRAERWLVGGAAFALVVGLITQKAEAAEVPLLKINAQCVDGDFRSNNPRTAMPRIKVDIEGSIKKSSGSDRLIQVFPQHSAPVDQVYMVASENRGGRRYVVTNISVRDDHIGVGLDGFFTGQSQDLVSTNTKRTEFEQRYIKPFTQYTFTVGTASFTMDQFPRLRDQLATGAFNINCTMTEGGQLLPDWSIPETFRTYPLPLASQGPLPKQY